MGIKLVHGDITGNIKRSLVAQWPGVKFSVSKGKGTACSWVHIRWTDGPTDAQVQSIAGQFETVRFDGCDDEYHRTGEPLAKEFGGCSGIGSCRHISPDMVALALQTVWAAFSGNLKGVPIPPVEDFKKGRLWGMKIPGMDDDVQHQVNIFTWNYDACAGQYIGDSFFFKKYAA